MHVLEPLHVEPHYWALVTLVGLTPHAIAERAEIGRSTCRRAALGQRVEQRAVSRLRGLLATSKMELGELLARAQTDAVTEKPVRDRCAKLRAEVYATIDFVLEFYQPTPQIDARDRCAEDLRVAVGEGRSVNLVIADLRIKYRPATVRRAATRLGLLERQVRLKTGVTGTFWYPPTRSDVAATPAHTRPTTPNADRIWRYVEKTLSDGEAHPARPIVDALLARGHSRPSVYKAARDMRLVRVTTGFGPTKSTTWQLPPRRPEPLAPAGKLVRVDFRPRTS